MHIAFVCVVPRSVRHGGCPSCGGCMPGGREARAARALPGRAAVLSLSAPWQKSKRRDNDTPRSNSKQRTDHRRFKVQKGRSKKVQGQATTPASTTPHPTTDGTRRRRNGALRHSAHGRPQPSVITIRYPSRSYVTRYSTRGSPVAHAGRCSDALLLLLGAPWSVLVASSRCVRTGHDHTDTQSRWCGGVVVVSRYFYLCVAHVAACVIEIMSMRICVSEL